MTLYELLHQVSFDEIVPFIERYHGWNALALYKIHYDYPFDTRTGRKDNGGGE